MLKGDGGVQINEKTHFDARVIRSVAERLL